ncbi:hypothetical protein J3458_012287 [Metarhizium acridum]|uniref:uncharacterized protein n=1 Tax=Metarhizium acridum TaxID=92637 RepID=UPI001C6B78CB|nr:hypothetical protein J3458_012287 [Metarhizium acridum]
MELGPYRIFCINGWKACDAEKDLSAMTVDNISLALAASEGDPKWYGTLNDYYAAVKSTVGAMFEPDLSHSLTLTLCVGDTTGDYCEIQFIDRDYNQSRFSVLVLRTAPLMLAAVRLVIAKSRTRSRRQSRRMRLTSVLCTLPRANGSME